jgi:outer membrane protein insertion porin family
VARGAGLGSVVAVTLGLAALSLAGCAHDEIGTGVWVESFDIEGNQALSDGDIIDRLATHPTGWWPFASRAWFDQAAFDVDLKRITAFYADHGFFDARVLGERVQQKTQRSVGIVVRVQENTPTTIGDVRIDGLPPDEEPPARKLAASLSVAEGRRFDYEGYAALRAGVEQHLHDHGYGYAKVTGQVDVDRDKHVAVVALKVEPGPLLRFGATTVEGNGNIPAQSLENRVVWKPGQLFDPQLLVVTQRRIAASSAFSTVQVTIPEEPPPPGAPDVANVRIVVHPGSRHEIVAGGGVGAERLYQEVRARLEYHQASFLGGLRRLEVSVRPAYVVLPGIQSIQQQGLAAQNEVRFTQPDFLARNLTLRALAGYDLGIAQGYQFHGPRGSVGVDYPFFRDRLVVATSWNMQFLTFFNVNTEIFNQASNRFFGFPNPYRLAYLEALIQLDLRDQPLEPTVGSYFLLRVEHGDPWVGGEFRYVRITPEARFYAPLARRLVLATRLLAGWLEPESATESPITRRYTLGGPSSHRGFAFGRLSPQVPDAQGELFPVGGDGQLLVSAELRIRVFKLSGSWVGLIPFVDAGDVTARFSDIDPADLNVATGAFLDYQTPVGVARVGLGIRLNRLGPGNPDPGDRFNFHIAIGEAF